MANIGDEREIVHIPEPQAIPDTVPESAPAERESEEVPA